MASLTMVDVEDPIDDRGDRPGRRQRTELLQPLGGRLG
jgi:hypothetical protein